MINENCILRKHESVTRKLDFKIKTNSSQVEELPKYSKLMEILSRKEDKLSLFEFMRGLYLEAREGEWGAR